MPTLMQEIGHLTARDIEAMPLKEAVRMSQRIFEYFNERLVQENDEKLEAEFGCVIPFKPERRA
jgi:hypothetical protein